MRLSAPASRKQAAAYGTSRSLSGNGVDAAAPLPGSASGAQSRQLLMGEIKLRRALRKSAGMASTPIGFSLVPAAVGGTR